MTGVELPQVSLQRYVDLVRRRRWQLVPVSVFGLLVGAVVAFLIPRYYVAETMIERSTIEGEFPPNMDDPLRSIVQGAQSTLPWASGKALERLKWPEWVAGDGSERTQMEKELRARIVVTDTNALDRQREYALIRVSFRDQNAAHAADFANALVQTWVDDGLAKLREGHEKQRERANIEYGNWSDRFARLLAEEQDYRERFHLRPNVDPAIANLEDQRRREDLKRDRDDFMNKGVARTLLAESIKKDQEKLRNMPERVPPSEGSVLRWAQQLGAGATPAKLTEAAAYVKTWSDLKETVATIDEGTIQWRRKAAQLKQLETRLFRALEIELDPRGEMINLDFTALAAKLLADREKLAQLETEVAALEKRLAAQQAEQDAMPEGLKLLKENLDKQRNAQVQVGKWFESMQKQEDILRALEARKPMQQVQPAKPPPHPTDPNIFVVALIGAVLGLGVAIGLILLLDLLQGSFKTVDDVERGLGVPVLGGLSHLETEEERTIVVRGRRRAAIAAFAFVALVVVVVTFYYIAPTRLPGIVRDLLRGLLGS